jgi:hypothetical protein
MVDITLRSELTRAMTHTEVDTNFSNLKTAIEKTTSFRMNYSGFLEPTISKVRYYPIQNIEITGYFITIGIGPTTGGNLIIKKNNIDIATIAVLANTLKTDIIPFSLALAVDDYLTVDTTLSSGKDLSLIFTYR